MKKVLFLILILVLLSGAPGCQKLTEEPKGETPLTPTPIPTPVVTAQPVNPTPTPVPSPVETPRPENPTPTPAPTEKPSEAFPFLFPQPHIRPAAVIIDNGGGKGYPQAGLVHAQIVYEVIVEGGMSRFIALFWESYADLIGPVRSVRHYMLDFLLPYRAILFHVGGSTQAMRDIHALRMDTADSLGRGGYIYRKMTRDRNNWQDTYTQRFMMNQFISGFRIPTTSENVRIPAYHPTFTVPSGGIPARTISITYSPAAKAEYVYDEKQQVYIRQHSGKAHIDREQDIPLSVTNIIIQFTQNSTIPGDLEGRQNMRTVGEGTGFLITGGQAVDIVWKKTSREAPTLYYDRAGKEIVFNPGNIWVQVVPIRAEVNIH